MIAMKWRGILALLMSLALLNSACQKDQQEQQALHLGNAQLTIKLQGVQNVPDDGTANDAKSAKQHIQEQSIRFGKLQLFASLSPRTAPKRALRASSKRAVSTGPGSINDLPADVACTTYIYAGNSISGNPVGQFSFNATQAGQVLASLAPGQYTFVTTAYGKADESGPRRDPMASDPYTLTIVDEQVNTLPVLLKHKLSEVEVIFNPGATITNIAGGSVSPNQGYSFNEKTGTVTFLGTTDDQSFSFDGQSGSTWRSTATVFATEETQAGSITLQDVTINGQTHDAVSNGWSFRPGVQYTLNIGLRPANTIDIPGAPVYMAQANLNANGDGLEDSQSLQGGTYDAKGSQGYCEGTLGAGWHTPISTEMQALMDLGTVRGTYESQSGWFLGTSSLEKAEAAPDNYMFLADNADLVQEGNGGNSLPTGYVGAYWADPESNGNIQALILFEDHVSLEIVHQNNQLGIRCVRAK